MFVAEEEEKENPPVIMISPPASLTRRKRAVNKRVSKLPEVTIPNVLVKPIFGIPLINFD